MMGGVLKPYQQFRQSEVREPVLAEHGFCQAAKPGSFASDLGADEAPPKDVIRLRAQLIILCEMIIWTEHTPTPERRQLLVEPVPSRRLFECARVALSPRATRLGNNARGQLT